MTLPLTALALAGLAFGASSGLHCAAMCGPLAACATRSPSRRALPLLTSRVDRAGLLSYQSARALGYLAAGALAGGLGAGVSGSGLPVVASGLTWAMALWCVVRALGWRPPARSPLTAWLARRIGQVAPRWRGAWLGALTPLLPCGLLVSAYALAMATGSALRGAALVGSFALGSAVPLLGVQLGWAALGHRLGSRPSAVARRGLLLLTALTLAWRGWALWRGDSASCHLS